jgi:hypothetical protein
VIERKFSRIGNFSTNGGFASTANANDSDFHKIEIGYGLVGMDNTMHSKRFRSANL